jgi:hypothetical protein
MSWVAIDDLLGILHHVLEREDLAGPVNAVAPTPATNAEFTKALGRALGRPTIAPLPAFALRLAFGEMAEATLLSSTRVRPERLLATSYRFFPDLGALRHLLGRWEVEDVVEAAYQPVDFLPGCCSAPSTRARRLCRDRSRAVHETAWWKSPKRMPRPRVSMWRTMASGSFPAATKLMVGNRSGPARGEPMIRTPGLLRR